MSYSSFQHEIEQRGVEKLFTAGKGVFIFWKTISAGEFGVVTTRTLAESYGFDRNDAGVLEQIRQHAEKYADKIDYS